MIRNLVKANGVAAMLGCEFLCACDGAVGDYHAAEAAILQVVRRELYGFAGTDQQRSMF